jgi:thiosulfate reductase/polysulfide reductase chain A
MDIRDELDDYPFTAPGTPTDLIRKAAVEGKPYPIKGCVVWGQNPIQTIPNQKMTIDMLMQMDFVMCVDVSPTDITMYADILLPEACYLERYDHIEKGTQWDCAAKPQQFIAPRMPLVDPMFERKDPVWIINGLAERMGVGHAIPVKTQEEYVDHCLEEAELTLAKIRKEKGIYIQEGESSYLEPGDVAEFNTESEKIELYLEEMAEEGFSPVPIYTKVPEPPKGYARMIYGRSPVHSFNRSQNNAWLHHEIPENPLWLNDELAAKMGIKDGDRVSLENQDGVKTTGSTIVKVTPGIRKDVVYLAHGYGTDNPAMTVAHNQGIDDQSMNTRTVIEPETGCCGMRVNFVRLIKDGKAINIPA